MKRRRSPCPAPHGCAYCLCAWIGAVDPDTRPSSIARPPSHSAKPLDKFAALQICQIRTLNKLAATPASHRNGRPLPSFWMILCRFLACASDEQTTPSGLPPSQPRHLRLKENRAVRQPRNSHSSAVSSRRGTPEPLLYFLVVAQNSATPYPGGDWTRLVQT